MLIMLVAVGCGEAAYQISSIGSEIEKLEEKIVGSYEDIHEGHFIHKLVFLENGKAEYHSVGVKEESEWKIVGKEVHVDLDDFISVWKIEPNGNLTNIAEIEDGKRTDLSKEKQSTFKKLK